METEQPQGWHIKPWGTWGWIETILKSAAMIVGIAAFFATSGVSELTIGGHPRLAAVILLALLALGTIVQLVWRIIQKEIISIAYAIIHLLGHFGLLIALLRAPDERGYAIAFGVIYILGDLAKQRFLAISGYTEGGLDARTVINGSRAVIGIYVLFVVLMLV